MKSKRFYPHRNQNRCFQKKLASTQFSYVPFWEFTFIATATRLLPDSLLLSGGPNAQLWIAHCLPWGGGCSQLPTPPEGASQIFSLLGEHRFALVSVFSLKSTVHRAWCFMFQHLSGWTTELSI